MRISKLLSDDAILGEIGKRLERRRLDLQLTQAELANQAGIAKRTVERIEAGLPAQTSSVIRVFRVLELLPRLDRMIPETGPRPMELLERRGKIRKRASSSRHRGRSDKEWTWNDGE